MNHFSDGSDGKPSSTISLNKEEFMNAITDLLANSQWEYLLGSPEWEKQLDMLFNKVDVLWTWRDITYNHLRFHQIPANL